MPKHTHVARFLSLVLVSLALACGCVAVSGCSGGQQGDTHVVVGALPTEDILPYWVAESDGIFEQNGLEVEVQTFQSATELIAAVQSGTVDLAMTDPMVAASIDASGTDVEICWVTLGLTPEQGRFGIMVGPDSAITSPEQLAGVPIGVGSNTILEYVMDNLLADAGVPHDQIMKEELQKLPVRYQAMLSGQVQAAALPGSLLALGEANGCRTIIDDSQGRNISQSVMIYRSEWRASEGGTDDVLAALQDSWDQAAARINENPEAYRDLLVEKAQLSEEVADTYPISEYPLAELPDASMIDPVLEWMLDKGYLKTPLSYDAGTGAYEAA